MLLQLQQAYSGTQWTKDQVPKIKYKGSVIGFKIQTSSPNIPHHESPGETFIGPSEKANERLSVHCYGVALEDPIMHLLQQTNSHLEKAAAL